MCHDNHWGWSASEKEKPSFCYFSHYFQLSSFGVTFNFGPVQFSSGFLRRSYQSDARGRLKICSATPAYSPTTSSSLKKNKTTFLRSLSNHKFFTSLIVNGADKIVFPYLAWHSDVINNALDIKIFTWIRLFQKKKVFSNILAGLSFPTIRCACDTDSRQGLTVR